MIFSAINGKPVLLHNQQHLHGLDADTLTFEPFLYRVQYTPFWASNK